MLSVIEGQDMDSVEQDRREVTGNVETNEKCSTYKEQARETALRNYEARSCRLDRCSAKG